MLYGVGDCMIALLYRDCLKARKPGFVALEILGICVTLAVGSAVYGTLQPVMDVFLSFVLPGLLVTISVFKLSSLVYGDHICNIISRFIERDIVFMDILLSGMCFLFWL